MRAIVRQQFGDPDQLRIQTVPDPEPTAGEVLMRVRAFGLNRAEQYFRQGLWGEVAAISGIECVGTVEADPGGRLERGQTVIALMGGMGRSRAGSYAEKVCVPASNVVAVDTRLDWTRLASLPETYATAWSCLHDNLSLRAGDRLLLRGAGSALGQAAIELASRAGATVLAETRSPRSAQRAAALGATAAGRLDELSEPQGLDAVLDLIGTTTLRDSLRRLGRGGRACVAGFLGGGAPLAEFDPLRDLPSGRQLSFFGSAFVYGTADYPLADIPFQSLVDQAERGELSARPAAVFRFDDIQAAHRLLDAEMAGGKIVVEVN
ncbi:zinc-binding dehydrogenase [Roseateles sp. BYS78W]|uniref:Zinc-binding dehydrogenase n=1 Tax=Pelomonas candidula TaxID=3299025 RepID=A0ABW7HHM9_9BURK